MTAIEGAEIPEIPATVTLAGEELFGLVARLLAAWNLCMDETARCETDASMMLESAVLDLFSAAFGPFLRDCEQGEPDGCRCAMCQMEGDWEDLHTPLWLSVEKRGEEWLTHWAAIDSAA